MKFLLTSSGLTNASLVAALTDLTLKPLNETAFLFIPTAAYSGVGDRAWVTDAILEFQQKGFKSVTVLDITGLKKAEWEPHFENADVICFGGGDEKYLARVVLACGMKEYFQTAPDTKVYMGISAGSMIAGHFPPDGYAEVLFPEDGFPNVSVTPMELLDLVFLPHLNSSWFAHMRVEGLETLKEKLSMSTYATDDNTALKIDGDTVEIVGGGTSWIFEK